MFFLGKTSKNTLSKFSAEKMINTLPSSVASWRSKKDIQENPKACETFAFVQSQFPRHYHRSHCFPQTVADFSDLQYYVIQDLTGNVLEVKNSSFLTPWIKFDAYVSINLIFFAETVCLLFFNKFFKNKTTDNGGILSSFISSSIVGVQINGGKILQ